MSKVLEAIAFAAADECERYSIAEWYEHSSRAESALASLSEYLGSLEISPEEHDEAIDLLDAVMESYRSEGFCNGFRYAMKLAQELK
ncbi:MAG: hypothetical protein LIO51_04670 [Clostridiales bacterium]|nr:hypothetical protein [Clostridiales bacterium]